MSEGRLLKCYGTCGIKYPKSEMTQLGGKNYCQECYKVREKTVRERKRLTDYLDKEWGGFDPRFAMEIKRFEEQGYTVNQLYISARYCIRIAKLEVHREYGLNCLAYYMESALKYNKKMAEQAKQVKSVPEPKPVTVALKEYEDRDSMNRKYMESKVWDLGELDDE